MFTPHPFLSPPPPAFTMRSSSWVLLLVFSLVLSLASGQPLLWFSASNLTGSPVSVWPDISGNGYSAIQANATQQPTLLSTGMNGFPTVSFTQSLKQWLIAPSVFPSHVDYSIIALIQIPFAVSEWLVGTNVTGHEFGVFGSDLSVSNDPASAKRSNTTIPSNKATLATVVYSFATQSLQFFINGAPAGNATTISNSARPIFIGCSSNQLQCWNGFVSEILIFNYSLSSSQRQSYEETINTNYCLSLPYYVNNSINYLVPGATANEQFLISRNAAFFASLQCIPASAVMLLMATGGTNGPDGLADNNLGGISSSSTSSKQQSGSASTLIIALYHGFPQYLSQAITTVQNDVITRIYQFNIWWNMTAGNDGNGGVKLLQELGGISRDVWLLNKAGAYFVAPPGSLINTSSVFAAGIWTTLPPPNNTLSVQALYEQFFYSYIEQCAGTFPCILAQNLYWGTTGYNKQVSQGLASAYMIGVYGDAGASTIYPNTYTNYLTQLWDGMLLGQQGSYEPDNSPIYANLNVDFVIQQAIGMNRFFRNGSTDPHAFLSDSVDFARVIQRLNDETMPNGNALNYNRAISNWQTASGGSCSAGSVCYSFNTAEATASSNLKWGYLLYGNASWLYTARMIDQFYVTTGTFSTTTIQSGDLYPANINAYNVFGIEPPQPESFVELMRTSPGCGNGYDLCFACPQFQTILTPKAIILRAGVGETSAYSMMSIGAAGGPHANTDQRMTLENIIVNDVYVAARPNGPIQSNQCNCVLVVPTSVAFPVPSAIFANATTYYTQMNQQSSTTTAYVLQGASATQLSNTSAYGELTHSQYLFVGYHSTRQVLLQATGLTIVIDSVYYDGSLPINGTLGLHEYAYGGANGGMTWRLWPSTTASGSNWMLQAPVFGVGTAAFLSSTTNSSTLFWISEASGRTYGTVLEPLSDEYSGSASSETITTFYAYDNLSDQLVHTFVTVLVPLAGTAAATASSVAAGITVYSNTDGSTTVTVQGSNVTVPASPNIVPQQKSVLSLSATTLLNQHVTGDFISFWEDGGSGNALVQPTAGLQPVFNTTAMNGGPSVLFTASQKQWLISESNVFPIDSDYTIIALVQYPFHATQYIAGGLSDSHSFGIHSSQLVVQHDSLNGGDANFIGNSNISVPTGVPVVVAAVYSVAQQSVTYYINGNAQGTSFVSNESPSNPTPGTIIDPTLIVGAQGGGGLAFNGHPVLQDFWNGYISELHIFNYQRTDILGIGHTLLFIYGLWP